MFCIFWDIGEAVFARCLSSLKDERVKASKYLKGPSGLRYKGDKKEFVEHIRKVSIYSSVSIFFTIHCYVSYIEFSM